MRIFITGASGFIGSAVTAELLRSGHEVVGLARSDESAAAIAKVGATPLRGSLEDIDVLKKGASESDGVINLGFSHDFSKFAESIAIEVNAVEAMGEVLKGTSRPFLVASGGPTMSEADAVSLMGAGGRGVTAQKTLDLATQGVRSSVVRLSNSVHDGLEGGFSGMLVRLAKEKGASGYGGDGSGRWTAVHRLDAARLFRLAIEKAPAGSILHAVADQSITVKEIAEAIGVRLNLPIRSVPDSEAEQYFGFLARFMHLDLTASSVLTQQLLDWHPTHAGLIEDLARG